MKNELGEDIIVDDLSLDDVFGWMDKDNRKFRKAVKTLVHNSRLYNERISKGNEVQLHIL